MANLRRFIKVRKSGGREIETEYNPIEPIVFPFAFDTPGIIIPETGPAGIFVCHLHVGDELFGVPGENSCMPSIIEAWDVSGEFDHVYLNLVTSSGRGNLPDTSPDPFTESLFVLDSQDEEVTPELFKTTNSGLAEKIICRTETNLYAYIDDGSGADPESTQGRAELRMLICRAG